MSRVWTGRRARGVRERLGSPHNDTQSRMGETNTEYINGCVITCPPARGISTRTTWSTSSGRSPGSRRPRHIEVRWRFRREHPGPCAGQLAAAGRSISYQDRTSFGFGGQHVRHQPAGGPTRPHGAAIQMMNLHVGMFVTRRMSASNVRSGRWWLCATSAERLRPSTDWLH